MAFSWKQPRPQAGTSSNSGATSAGRVTRCKCCGGTDFVDFSESGDRGCAQCGTVLQENNIVSTVQFSESGGSSNVVGQFVSGDKGRPSGGGGGAGGRGRGRFGHSRDSRETTIQNGKKRIGQVLGATLLCCMKLFFCLLRSVQLCCGPSFDASGRRCTCVLRDRLSG